MLEDRVFTSRKIRVAAVLWFAGYATLLGRFFFRYHWPYYPKEFSSGCVDFGWVWLSGHLAALHQAASVFNYASFAKAQADLLGVGSCSALFWFPYPPTLLFFTYPFGLLPFTAAYVLWSVLLALLFAGAVYAIVRRANAAIAAPATFPAVVNLYIGQNAFLTAGLFGFALATLERRPILAGFLFALLTVKPQYGMMIPIALLASRNWRALGSAAAFSIGLAALAAIAFGRDGWVSFFDNMANRNLLFIPDSVFHLRLASIYGMLHSAGFADATAFAVQGIVVLVMAAAVWVTWSRPTPYPLRASLLCIASFLATPYVLYYDLCLLTIPFAFLISDGLRRGFLPNERTMMFVCWEVFSFGQSGAMFACALLLWLVGRRIVKLREVPTPAGVLV